MNSKKIWAGYFRSMVFGVEDSLVSTVGLLSGVAIANVPKSTIFLTGIVLIFVEAFSMAVGSYLSEYSAEEYIEQKEISGKFPLRTGVVMFFSYFIFGFVPLLPYIFFSIKFAFYISIILSLATLFVLGGFSGRLARANRLRSGLRMLLVGGGAIILGIIIGKIVGRPSL